MTRILLIMLCLLLCGCSAETGEIPAPVQTPSVMVGQGEDRGSVRVFPVWGERITGLRSLGDGLLIFSGEENTRLTLLQGDALEECSSLELAFLLDPWDPTLIFSQESLSFYDPTDRQMVCLDGSLQEKGRIPAPEGLTGHPILSPDGSRLYYITGSILRVWDLNTEQVRCIKDFSGLHPLLLGLHLDGTILQCTVREEARQRTVFLDGENGSVLREKQGMITLRSRGQIYSAILPSGMEDSLVWGRAGELPRLLLPEGGPQICHFLDESPGAVTVTAGESGVFTLDYYDMDRGNRIASLSLASDHVPMAAEDTGDGRIYLLLEAPEDGQQTIYQWDPWRQPLPDRESYVFPCAWGETPDPQGLQECEALAEKIGSKYGLQIRLWKEAVQAEPWDFQLEPEYQTGQLYRELERLDRLLSRYPREILEETASHFSGLNLCLVRQVTGSPESGSLNTATGVQFLEGTDAYVVLAVGPYLEQALYHELFHAMETHILTNSTAFDRWDELNPAGFRYDYDYLANDQRDSGVYLRQEYRAFVDTFSMSFPKEDRARVMEYAMLPGKKYLFQTEKMQGKLQALCQGIREAYGLEEISEAFPWEQYLES